MKRPIIIEREGEETQDKAQKLIQQDYRKKFPQPKKWLSTKVQETQRTPNRLKQKFPTTHNNQNSIHTEQRNSKKKSCKQGKTIQVT